MTRSKVFSKVFKLQRCLITNHNVSVASAMDNESVRVFTILESVVYYIDPKSPGSLGFLGGKERIRIPISSTHSSFEAFKRHIIEHAGLKAEAEKRGLGSCIALKLCSLVKTQEGRKAYSINTQAQWDVERPLFVSSAVLQGGYIILYSIARFMKHLETLNNFVKESVGNVMAIFEKPCKPLGTMGTVSSQTLSSVGMILEGLRALQQLLKELKPRYEVDLHTCLTVQVENLHVMGHFREQFPTFLEYARNLANTVYESIKRVVQWDAYYYTHEKSYYPVVSQATPLNTLPRMSHRKPTSKLNDRERDVMFSGHRTMVKLSGNELCARKQLCSKQVRYP